MYWETVFLALVVCHCAPYVLAQDLNVLLDGNGECTGPVEYGSCQRNAETGECEKIGSRQSLDPSRDTCFTTEKCFDLECMDSNTLTRKQRRRLRRMQNSRDRIERQQRSNEDDNNDDDDVDIDDEEVDAKSLRKSRRKQKKRKNKQDGGGRGAGKKAKNSGRSKKQKGGGGGEGSGGKKRGGSSGKKKNAKKGGNNKSDRKRGGKKRKNKNCQYERIRSDCIDGQRTINITLVSSGESTKCKPSRLVTKACQANSTDSDGRFNQLRRTARKLRSRGKGKRGRRKGKKVCRYRTIVQGTCDLETRTVTHVQELRRGDADICEAERTITRSCGGRRRRGRNCLYDPGEWTSCSGGAVEKERVDSLRNGSDEECPPTRTLTKDCRAKPKSACKYILGDWGQCTDESKSRIDTLRNTSDPECPPTRTVTKQCRTKAIKNRGKRCQYEKGEWSSCENAEKKHRIDTLIPGSDSKCKPTRVRRKNCKQGRGRRGRRGRRNNRAGVAREADLDDFEDEDTNIVSVP